MNKKMKGAAFEDVRASFKHQTLVQGYIELQQETEAARNNLITMKQKKQTLEAEVRFLRRRHKFLLKINSLSAQEVKYQNIETTQYRNSKNEKVNPKKATTLPVLPPIPNLNHRNNMYSKKKNFVPSRLTPVFDLERNVDLYGFNLNQRFHGNNLSLGSEFHQKESGFSGKEAVVQTRGPKFDLNQISVEEEEAEERFDDLKLSMYRNVNDGSTNLSGKRKISWQDPVALRV